MILYPPLMDDVLPAQTTDKMTIPFKLNRTQGIQDVQNKYIWCRFKHIVSGLSFTVNYKFKGNELEFVLPMGKWQDKKLFPSNLFYKVQLGWSEDGEIEPEVYSTVSVFKLLEKAPIVTIDIMESGANIEIQYDDNKSDEKLYSATLTVKMGEVIIFESGL